MDWWGYLFLIICVLWLLLYVMRATEQIILHDGLDSHPVEEPVVFPLVTVTDSRLARRRVVFLDTETTGIRGRQEVLEIAIVDAEGKILVNSLVHPSYRKRWPDAQEIHGISPAHVADAPSLDILMPSIINAVKDKTVVIYNAKFDLEFLPEVKENAGAVRCCMLRYAKFKGDWNEYHNDYRWHKLTAAARYIGYGFDGDAHRALADCQATRAVWQHMES